MTQGKHTHGCVWGGGGGLLTRCKCFFKEMDKEGCKITNSKTQKLFLPALRGLHSSSPPLPRPCTSAQTYFAQQGFPKLGSPLHWDVPVLSKLKLVDVATSRQ
jgi:hypothetical protein